MKISLCLFLLALALAAVSGCTTGQENYSSNQPYADRSPPNYTPETGAGLNAGRPSTGMTP